MPNFKYLPLKQLDAAYLLPLMEEEEKEWLSDLGWDYSPIKNILASFVQQKLLPGYVAVINETDAVGYTYFLVNQAKGIIGALYVTRMNNAQVVTKELLTNTIACLKDYTNIKRIEAQIMPFNDLDLTSTFIQNGFTYYLRYYMDLDLKSYDEKANISRQDNLHPWNSSYMEQAGEMTFLSYQNQVDAEICEDYCSQAGCTGYLRSLVENPGCGIFMPETSFMALDDQGEPCGYVICCSISSGFGMIPQIAIHPSYQGLGLGNALMHRCLQQLRAMGYHSISLTVTQKNQRAFDWYQRLGFRIRKAFGGYMWQR
jgi:ribosomal protein S18 acetylase RimI-like enzyme